MQSMNISSKYLTGLQDGFPTSSSIFEARNKKNNNECRAGNALAFLAEATKNGKELR